MRDVDRPADGGERVFPDDPGWQVSVVGVCHACRHRRDVWTCDAYPDLIPPRVMAGDLDHRFPLPGDRGTWFDLDPLATDPPPDTSDDLGVLCRALASEPLLHASLGSKELFHSNMLARLVEVDPQAGRRIFQPWLSVSGNIEPTRVRREHRHVDLLIEFNGHAPLLVENKTFALPDEQQLRRYADEVAPPLGEHVDLILLSLTDPGWTNNELIVGARRWRWVSYGELAERIRGEFWDQSDFEPQVFAHEARLLDLLDRLRLATSIRSADGPFELSPGAARTLRPVRLADAVGKMRAYQLRQLIAARYAEEGLEPSELEVSFTRGLPLVSGYWAAPNGDSVGWQLQGRQWRLAMILRSLAGTSATSIASRSDFAATQVRWFDFHPYSQITGADVEPDRAFNRYNPDFVYRYRLLGPATTVGAIVELAVAYGRLAQQFEFRSSDGPLSD